MRQKINAYQSELTELRRKYKVSQKELDIYKTASKFVDDNIDNILQHQTQLAEMEKDFNLKMDQMTEKLFNSSKESEVKIKELEDNILKMKLELDKKDGTIGKMTAINEQIQEILYSEVDVQKNRDNN